jgi:hypothetical protein
MLIQLQPCVAGWSPAEILTAGGAVITAVLTAFLSVRRIKADKTSTDRFHISGIRQLETHSELSRIKEAVSDCCGGSSNNKKGRPPE